MIYLRTELQGSEVKDGGRVLKRQIYSVSIAVLKEMGGKEDILPARLCADSRSKRAVVVSWWNLAVGKTDINLKVIKTKSLLTE